MFALTTDMSIYHSKYCLECGWERNKGDSEVGIDRMHVFVIISKNPLLLQDGYFSMISF